VKSAAASVTDENSVVRRADAQLRGAGGRSRGSSPKGSTKGSTKDRDLADLGGRSVLLAVFLVMTVIMVIAATIRAG